MGCGRGRALGANALPRRAVPLRPRLVGGAAGGNGRPVNEGAIGYNEVNKRIPGRRLCPNNRHSNPPKFSDVCNFSQARAAFRSEDSAQVMEERLRIHERKLPPVLPFSSLAVFGFSRPRQAVRPIVRLVNEA